MDNYEYIVASLPVLRRDAPAGSLDADVIISSIRSQLSEKDCKSLEMLLDGYESEKLDADFYRKALSCRNRFLREYFRYDLGLRNTKVAWLNASLGRAEGTDMVVLDEDGVEEEFEGRDAVNAVLNLGDILSRERGLDELMWAKVDELTTFDVFNLDAILGFVAKMKTVDRWLKLDAGTGMEMFRKLVSELRSTYDNKKQNYI